MKKQLARYLTVLIANDLKHYRDVSSGACEMIENKLINNKFDEVENYIKNFLKDTRKVNEIVEE